MVDQVLRIGIDSTQAESGARKVIASLKAIQAEAARAVAAGIPIKIDASGIADAKNELARALRDIGGGKGAEIPVSFDLSSVDAEAAKIISEIQREVGRGLGEGIPVEASLDIVTAAEAEIDRVLREAEAGVSISVDADTADAEREIGRLRNTLTGSGLDDATIRIALDASDVVGEAGRVEDAIRQVGDAAADVSRDAEAQIGGIKLDVDTSEFRSGLREISNALDGMEASTKDVSDSLKKVADALENIDKAVKKTRRSADDLGDAFSNITEDIEFVEFLGEAILGIATSIGTAILAFEDYEDAVKAATGTTAAAETAMEMLEGFALGTSVTLEDVTAAFVELRTNGLEASFESLKSYGNVAAALNLTMKEMSEAVSDAANRDFSKLNETQLKAKESGDKVIFTYHGVKMEVDNTSKAIVGLIKMMGNTEFAGAMEDAANGVGGAFREMSKAWIRFSEDMGKAGLDQGLDEFARSMVKALEEADKLGEILGGWLGRQAMLLGKDIEGVVDQLNDLVDVIDLLTGKIEGMPTLSSALGLDEGGTIGGVLSDIANSEFMKRAMPALYPDLPAPEAPVQGPPENPATVARRAFGTDEDQPRKPKRTAKTEAQRQAENFAEQTANNKELLRTLTLMDEAYERGRYAVEGFRNSVEELNIRQAAQKSVGKENAEAIVEQAMAIKYLEESMAFKAEVLGQQEAIIQTVDLAEAYKLGADAVEQAEAKQSAYNTAVQLGGVNMPGLIDQLTELAAAAKEANDNLKLEQNLFDLDQEIEATAKMATAYREGGGAVREAALEQQVYAAALAAGEADEEDSIARIREKMTALRDLQEIQQSDERAMMAGFDLEQMEGELRISQMVGEARYIEAERLEMLINKKRETKDATAELTAEEERLAAAMGRANAAMAGQSSALDDLANSIPNIAYAFEEATASGLMHFEDALVSIVTGTKSAREAFADMAKSIAADLARMAIRMAIIQPLAMMFGGMMGGGGMVATAAPMPLFHTGGIVGADPVPTRSFAALPKFHTGGIVGADDANPHPFAGFPKFHTGGLASSETPAVLQKGEGVFTKAQMAALQPVNNNNTSAPVTINVSVAQAQGSDPSVAENQGRIIAKQVQMAMGDYLHRQQKPGGILNANGGY